MNHIIAIVPSILSRTPACLRLPVRVRTYLRAPAHAGNPTIAVEALGGIHKGRRLRKTQRTHLDRWAF